MSTTEIQIVPNSVLEPWFDSHEKQALNRMANLTVGAVNPQIDLINDRLNDLAQDPVPFRFVASAGQTNFQINGVYAEQGELILVHRNGQYLHPQNDYTVTATLSPERTTITLATPANLSDVIAGVVYNIVTVQGGGTGGASLSLDDLNDVGVLAPQVNQALVFNGTNWINTTLNEIISLNGLVGVAVTGPANGQALIYNGTDWVNSDLNELVSLNGLTGVTISTPQNNQALIYNGTNWVNANLTEIVPLNGLSDVVITSPVVGHVLKWNGTNWVNDVDATGGATDLDGLLDVQILNPLNGQVLKYNVSLQRWVNEADATGGGAGNTNLSFTRDATTLTVLSDTGTDAILPAATTSLAGLLTGADKTKLDGIATGATATPLSSTTPAALGTAEAGVSTSASRADHVHALPAVATTGANGLMSSTDKTKLDGIAANATNTPLTSTLPSNLGTASAGVSSQAARADHVHNLPANATTSVAGLMSAADKTKLDGVATGATANATDAALRNRSTHTGTQAPSTISMATARLLGRSTAGTGGAEEIQIGTNLTLTAGVLSAQGGGTPDFVIQSFGVI